MRLGIDTFSLRWQGWDCVGRLEYPFECSASLT